MREPTGNRKWLLLLLLHCADAATKVSSLNQAQSQSSDSARKLPQFDDPQRRHGRARGLVFFLAQAVASLAHVGSSGKTWREKKGFFCT